MHGDHEHGAAWRRRQRRLRMHWRHEQLTLQMLLATYEHHAAPRGQMKARSGGWERAVLRGHVLEHPTLQAAGTEYFSLDVEDVPAAGSRPDRLFAVSGPQDRVQRRTVHRLSTSPLCRFSTILRRRWWNSCLTFSASFGRSHLIPSRLSKCPRSCLRTSPCAPLCEIRSWRNSWWKCLRSYLGPCCSRLWSRTLTFQLLIVV